jgi:hypothetical protein
MTRVNRAAAAGHVAQTISRTGSTGLVPCDDVVVEPGG